MMARQLEAVHYSERIVALIEGRTLRYIAQKRISRDAFASAVSSWECIYDWFPEYAADGAPEYPPITERLLSTWFTGDTSHGERRKTVPRPAAIGAIAHFLVEKGYILGEELNDHDDVGMALAFERFFGSHEHGKKIMISVGEFGAFYAQSSALETEVRIRLRNEYDEPCLTAEVIARNCGKGIKEKAYSRVAQGWVYAIGPDHLCLILKDDRSQNKYIWIVKTSANEINFEWFSDHFLLKQKENSFTNGDIIAIKMSNLTPNDRKLYYRQRGLNPDKIPENDNLGLKFTYEGPQIWDHLLLFCAAADDVGGAKLAISRGANINFIEPTTGDTALHESVWRGSLDVLELLLADERLNPTILDKVGRPASAGSLLALDMPELHVRMRELEQKWLKNNSGAPVLSNILPPPSPL